MAKMNKSGVASRARMAKLSRSGSSTTGSHGRDGGGDAIAQADGVNGGKHLTPYELGCQAWMSNRTMSGLEHPHMIEGWRAERKRSFKWASRCASAARKLEKRLGLDEFALA